MSERLTLCPKCQSRWIETVKIHNPETTDMNARATLRCETCKHEWEDRITSPHYRELRRLHRII